MTPDRNTASYHHRPARRLRTRLWQLAAVLLLVVAAYVVIGRQIMTLAPQWHQPLEARLEEQLGTALEIGAVEGRMDGLSPVLELQQLRLPAPEGAPLILDQVVLTLDLLSSVVEREPRLRRLLIRGAELELAREPKGGFSLKGLETRRDPPSLRQILTWMYSQNRVVFDEVRLGLHWPGMPPLRTRDLELALANSGRRHRISLRADSLDGERRLDLRLALERDVFRWKDFDGDLYMQLNGANWRRWFEAHWPWPVVPERLDGRVALWGRIENGQPQSASLKVELDRVGLRDRRNEARWTLTSAASLARLERLDDGYRLSLEQMQLTSPAGDWRAQNLGLFWNGERGPDLRWHALARGLDLADTRAQLLGLPFQRSAGLETWREQLGELAPSGQVAELHLAGGDSGVDRFTGRVTNLGSLAREGQPGVTGLSGWFAGSPRWGVARVDSEEVRLELPGLYDHPLEAGIRGALRWGRDGERLRIDSGRLEVANEDARVDTLFGLRVRPDQPAELRLVGDLLDGRATAAAHYVPDGPVAPALARWLDQAFADGRVKRGRFLYQGPVHIDPRRQQDRTFQMGFRVGGLRLHFLEGWPEIRDLSGRILIDGQRVEGRGLTGQLLDTELNQLDFDVPTAEPGTVPELIVSGRVRGPAGDLDQIFHDTPLRDQLPAAMHEWSLKQGRLSGHLVLRWPLADGGPPPLVLGQGRIEQARLVSDRLDVQASDLSGDFAYDLRRGLNMETLTGELLGEPVQGRIRSDDRETRVRLRGSAPVDRLRGLVGESLLRDARGRLDYEATVSIPRSGGGVHMTLSSPLTGLALDLPAPLGKGADERAPLALDWRRRRNDDQLSLRYGQRVAARLYVGDKGVERGHAVLGGGSPRTRTEPGVRIDGDVDRIAIEPWVEWLRTRPGEGPTLPLERVEIKVARLALYGLTIASGRLSLVPGQAGGWEAELDSEQLAGQLRLPEGYRPEGQVPLELVIRNANLRLSGGEEAVALNPAALPIANVKLNNIRVNDTDYGRWRFDLRPVDEGVMLRDVQGQWRNTRFNGRLQWVAVEQGTRSHFVGRLTSARLEDSLTAFGLAPMIESKHARSVVDLSWPGSPLAFDYRSTSGNASLDIGSCRIPETSRGASALRVLGILNVSSLSRRMRLDFSDLYKKGLSCDSISGDLRLAEARIATDNLVIESPSAEFRIRGELNLEQETLDHRMDVTLPLSSNLYAGCLAGPAACAGIFVFERLWGNELEKMTTLSYRVTGTWQDPKVRELEDPQDGPSSGGG